MNKKGDIPSLFYFIAIIFGIGVLIYFSSTIFLPIYQGIDTYFQSQQAYNGTEAHQAIQTIELTENGIWDWVFLGLVITYILGLIFTARATSISAVFFWIYTIISIIGLFVAVVLSYVWQEIAANPATAASTARFPVMNTLLGSYYPSLITIVLIIFIIVLFGKPSVGEGR